MAMVKTITAHNGCANIFKYLENERAVGREFINVQDRENWAQEFNQIREILGHDKQGGGRDVYDYEGKFVRKAKPITYRHYVLSPDPLDKALPSEVLDFAKEWSETNFPGGQVAIYVHGDTAATHAHVVLNASNLETFKKWQFNKTDVARLAKTAQVIGSRYGFRELPDIPKKDDEGKKPASRRQRERKTSGERYAEENRKKSKENIRERRIKEKGYVVWKDDLRKIILATAKEATSMEDMKRLLNERGYDMYTTRKGITYKTSKGYKCGSAKLGNEYDQRALKETFAAVENKSANIAAKTLNEIKSEWKKSPAGRNAQSRLNSTIVLRKEGIKTVNDIQIKTSELRSAADGLLKKNAVLSEKIESLIPVAETYEEYTKGIDLIKVYNNLSGIEKSEFIESHTDNLEKALGAERTLKNMGVTFEAGSRAASDVAAARIHITKNVKAVERIEERVSEINRAGIVLKKTQGEKNRDYLLRRGHNKEVEHQQQQNKTASKTKVPDINIDIGGIGR